MPTTHVTRTPAGLDAALQRVGSTVGDAAAQVVLLLAAAAESSARLSERDVLVSTQFELRKNGAAFVRGFDQALRTQIDQDLRPRAATARTLQSADWQTLSLVDDAVMEERMFADRIGQAISHACDAELREMAAYMGALLQSGRCDPERNPLRPEMLGAALHRATLTVASATDARKLLARELGLALAKTMPACYRAIIDDLHEMGLRPAVLTARSVDNPGGTGPSSHATFPGAHSQRSDFRSSGSSAAATDTARGDGLRSYPTAPGRTTSGGSSTLGSPMQAASRTRAPGANGPIDSPGRSGGHVGNADSHASDARLIALLRRLSAAASQPGSLDSRQFEDGAARGSSFGPGPLTFSGPGAYGAAASRFSSHAGTLQGESADSLRGDGVTGLMAVNLIRAHRDELLQASTGQLDHMVIDVVGSLFDQILSDSRVPPQMARQIARLQLPVLRVALRDASFFSSRRHPVRRFVNRMASLACAFDDFDDGPGRQFMERVRELVQEVVDGDFDQIDICTAQVDELERFIASQARREAHQSGAAAAIDRKEVELRLQQRHRLQLQTALAPLPLPAYLRDFVSQVWSQALVLAANRDGTDSERAQRFRRAGRDLVLSIQPKGSTAMRKKFLMQLPPLMKDLNEGMKLVGWPDTAQREFFGQLLPAHAESLRAPPISELDYNLLARRLEGIFDIPTATGDAADATEPAAEAPDPAAPPRFSPEEARAVGLVEESAVDWSGSVDIDLGLAAPDDPVPLAAWAHVLATGSPALDAALTAPPSEPTRGLALMDHIQLGFAYQMHLKDTWQKVRLTHVSASRGFFVFSHGRKHPQTISMTSRMLARMCETGRMRAVESAYLMERATQRARRQLAALKNPVVAAGLSSRQQPPVKRTSA